MNLNTLIKNNKKEIRKSIVSIRRYKTNELNPLAENEMIKILEKELQNDVIKKIIIEVDTFDLWSYIVK